jgi:glutamyl-tRNA synthetase
MTDKELADLIYPNITKTPEDYEKMYPKRDLKEGAVVSRFAPSPTGFVHMGSLLTTLIERKIPDETNGVFYLRIEDTDQKRSVENGIEGIVQDLKNFDIKIDEGALSETESIGNYGPYIQSQRKEIYETYAKHLVEEGLAYPCFCTPEEIDEIRKIQEINKERIGYYGSYAKCRTLSIEEAIAKIKNGEKYVVRFKSPGDFNKKITLDDRMRGKIEFPENDLDIVIIKSTDGLPTYHFAHAVDDHLMRVTQVIRGDEWVSSIPLHLELFKEIGFKPPKYAHTATIMKDENGSKRKISKRKDPEATMSYYSNLGYPKEAVIESLMTIINSNYEQWHSENPDKTYLDFEFNPEKMSSSGALYDLEKLGSLSRDIIAHKKASEVASESYEWAKEYSPSLKSMIESDMDYYTNILNIEREQEKPRKDIVNYSMIESLIWYMYDDKFENTTKEYEWKNITDINEIKNILKLYFDKYYDENDDKETWFNKVKELCEELGYASNIKEYKQNPDAYKGNVADISTVIRVAITSKSNTPDLYELMKLLGKDRIIERINMI